MTINERDSIIRGYYEHTELTLEQIAEASGFGYKIIWNTVARLYTPDVRKARKQKSYQASKLGNKNPMFGKYGEAHHNYIGEISDGKGYIIVLKPEWYTGRKGCKHVFKHTLVVCAALGLTELPPEWVVHHIDKDRTNNDLINLALMTHAAHMRLHQLERATISRKT